MPITKINDREFEIEFSAAMQGFRLVIREWDASTREWELVDNFIGDQFIAQTQFEALSSFTSQEFDDASLAELPAIALGIDIRFDEDEDCSNCDYFGNADEMFLKKDEDGFDIYLCIDCEEK